MERLLRDKVFLGTSVVLLVVLAVQLFPVLTEDQRWYWDNTYANLLLYATALVATLFNVRLVPSLGERRFWHFLAVSMGSIVVLYVLWLVADIAFPAAAESPKMELLSQASYLVFYLGFALALDASRGAWADELSQDLRTLRSAGVGLLLAGLLLYFVIVPAMVRPGDAVEWAPVILVYAALDTLFCLQFLRARHLTKDPRWRSLLGWMAAALGAWAVMDAGEAIVYLETFEGFQLGPVMELQWYIPIFLYMIAARVHLAAPIQHDPEVGSETRRLMPGGPIIAYTALLPVIHFSLYGLEVLDPELRSLREMVVLPLMVVIGAVALAHQRIVERQNETAHDQLRLSGERYRSFVESSVEGIWLLVFDPPISTVESEDEQVARVFRQGRIVESNEAMAEMYGFANAAEAEGHRLAEILQPVKNSETNVRSTREFIRSGYRALRAPLEFEDADGRLKHFDGSLVGVVEAGRLVRAWATQVDVTARMEAEAEKERLESQLRRKQKLDTIGTLAGGIAHDFNNMLAPILGFSELARESIPEDDPEGREYLDQVKQAALRAKQLVHQILAVGRKQESRREPLELASVVDEAVNLLRQSLPAYVIIETDYEVGCPQVLADSGQMHQVVMNLCTNARQAIGNRSGTVSVRIACLEMSDPDGSGSLAEGRYITLSVRDDGAGMDEDTLDRAFEAFFTTKSPGQGTGLGLSVSHGIVEAHGGHIRIDSEQGLGTIVTVYLPALAVSQEAVEGGGPTRPTGPSGARVILVDDDPAVSALGAAMLRRMGCDVLPFTDSLAARDALSQAPFDFDLLLTDHTMPHVTGPQLVEHARSLNPSLAVVVASGYKIGDRTGGAESCIQLGKPFSQAELEDAVASALDLMAVE